MNNDFRLYEHPMVIAKIMGGLGNQLFQYAMARSVAYRNEAEVKLDLGWFTSERTDGRTFFLDKFNVAYGVAVEAEIHRLLRARRTLGRDVYEAVVPFKRKRYVRLREFEPFHEKYLNLGGDVYLEGYWVDERYFRGISHILRREITLKDGLGVYGAHLAEAIRATQSVSLHVRRGDYMTSEEVRPIFNICDSKYYARAIDEIAGNVANPCFFVFSDDIEWVRRNLRTGHETVYVSPPDGDSPHKELVLMSLCRHNIIANSTFSWWGAWLNCNEGKIVIAPGKWFNIPGRYGRECVPAPWSKIEID